MTLLPTDGGIFIVIQLKLLPLGMCVCVTFVEKKSTNNLFGLTTIDYSVQINYCVNLLMIALICYNKNQPQNGSLMLQVQIMITSPQKHWSNNTVGRQHQRCIIKLWLTI